MRIIIDYLYATQIAGLLTTIILIIAITVIVIKVYPFNNFDDLPLRKKYFYRLLLVFSLMLCVFLFLQISINPFNVGRAGVIGQSAILKKTIVFTDFYTQGGTEPGETDPLMRVWVLDRETGSLITRKIVHAFDPILGANESSLIVGETDTCYMTDDRFKTKARFVENGRYRNKKVHRLTFLNGALLLTFKDFSESRIPLPLVARREAIKSGITFKYMDAERETYSITRRLNDTIIWQIDQSPGTMREHIPPLLYESPSNDCYLVWTECRLVAISKKTGKTIWTFRY